MTGTPNQHTNAVIAAVEAKLSALTAPWHAYDIDDVPAKRPSTYVVVVVSRRYVEGSSRLAGRKGLKGWRITVTAVSQRAGNARTAQRSATEALEDVRLTIDGVVASPIQFETEDPVSEEGTSGDWFTGYTSWTYNHGGNPNA